MKLLDASHPFYAPVWRRVAIVAVCFIWALVELSNDAVFWAILSAALGAYCLWEFFLSPDAPGRRPGDEP